MSSLPTVRKGIATGLVCVFAAVDGGVSTASAQSRFETITTINGAPSPAAAPQRTRGAPARAGNTDRAFPDPYAARPLPSPARDPETDTANSDNADVSGRPSTTEPDDPSTAPEPGTVDGDFSPPAVARGSVDGDFSQTTVEPVQDGPGAGPVDQRPEEDRAPFEQPPAGYDGSLFDVDVSPILTERPRQLFRFEPYTPLGIRMGSFVILPSVESSLVFDGNVFQSQPAERDRAVELLPTVRVVSDWRAHALEFRASGVLSRFEEFDSENAKQYELQARGRIDVTRRTNIEGLVSRGLTQESRSSLDANPLGGPTTGTIFGDRADVTTDIAALTLNHRFNRLGLQLRGAVTETDYADTTDALGAPVSSDARDENEQAIALRVSWEFKPTLFAFAEAEFNRRRYDAAAIGDNIRRDSRGQRYRGGVSFGNTDQVLRGEVSLGFGKQSPDDERLADVSGIILDANVAWRLSALTTLLFTAQTDFDDSTTTGASGSKLHSVGIEARHAFRRNLIANAGLTYAKQDYVGIDIEEEELRAIAGLEYFMSREISVFGRYQHTTFNSNVTGRDYRDNEFRLGMRWAR